MWITVESFCSPFWMMRSTPFLIALPVFFAPSTTNVPAVRAPAVTFWVNWLSFTLLAASTVFLPIYMVIYSQQYFSFFEFCICFGNARFKHVPPSLQIRSYSFCTILDCFCCATLLKVRMPNRDVLHTSPLLPEEGLLWRYLHSYWWCHSLIF